MMYHFAEMLLILGVLSIDDLVIALPIVAALFTLWINYFQESFKSGEEKRIFKKRTFNYKKINEGDSKKRFKRNTTIFSSIFLILILLFSFYKSRDDRNKAAQSLREQKKSYGQIDAVEQVSKQASESINQIKGLAKEASNDLKSLKGVSDSVKNNLTALNSTLNNNLKLSKDNFSILKSQNEDLLRPLPRIINVSMQISWSVQESGKRINSFIIKNKKSDIEPTLMTSYHNRFLIDETYKNFYTNLFIAYKDIKLEFTRENKTIAYSTMLIPKKMNSYLEQFYPESDDYYKYARFYYDSNARMLSLVLVNCPFRLTSVGTSFSFRDLDSSVLVIFTKNEIAQHYLTYEQTVTYIVDYGFFTPLEDGEYLHSFIKTDFAGYFSSCYNINASMENFQFKVPNFRAGHCEKSIEELYR